MGKPKIRFKGYEDDWEQRKVGNFLTESREVGHKGDVAHKMTVKLWSKGICEKNEAGSSNTQYFIRHTGQFIYSKLDFLNCAFGVVPKNLESFETTADVPAFDCNEINPYFMFYTAIQPAFYKKNGIIADGSRKAKRIHVQNFLNMPFFIPNLEEQNKIVDALSSLDHLITLHQRKCYRFIDIALDAWEQRKLDGWGTFYYGRSCPKWSVTEDVTIPCIRYGELYTKFGAKIDRVYSYTNMPPENLRFSKGTEVLIPRVGENPMDYNHCTWLSMKDVAIGEMISVFNTDNNPLFTATMFNATLQNEFAMRVEGGSVTNLYFEKLKNIDVSFPSIREQEMIAAYFENIDNLITLHQRKCDETKKLKKFMLQKMFPKKDEKKPEIRFAGFTDDWEQRKLIDYLEVSSEKNRDNRFTKDDVLSVSGEYGIVNQIEFQGRSFAGASVSNYGVVENGDVVYTKSPLKSNPYGIIKTNKGIPGIVSTLYAVYKPKEITDSKFVQIYFELDSRMNSYMHPLVNKGAKNDMKVSAENALKGMVSFPKKDEQEMISLYFSYLDNLIALHQRKCDEIKKIKKFMLQNMFPQKG